MTHQCATCRGELKKGLRVCEGLVKGAQRIQAALSRGDLAKGGARIGDKEDVSAQLNRKTEGRRGLVVGVRRCCGKRIEKIDIAKEKQDKRGVGIDRMKKGGRNDGFVKLESPGRSLQGFPLGQETLSLSIPRT